MSNNIRFETEEPLIFQEMILGLLMAIGVLLMVVSEVIGMLLVILGILSVSGIYVYRIIKMLKNGGELIYCCFSCLNNASMILAVVGILLLMLLTMHHRLIFFSALILVGITLLFNLIISVNKIGRQIQVNAQLRLAVVLVLLLVFFLL